MSEKKELLQKLRLTVGDRCKLVNVSRDLIPLPDDVELVAKRASIVICYAKTLDELSEVLKDAVSSLAPRVNLNVIFPTCLIPSLNHNNTPFQPVFEAGFRRITNYAFDEEHRAVRFYFDQDYGQSRRIELSELAAKSVEIRQKYQVDS